MGQAVDIGLNIVAYAKEAIYGMSQEGTVSIGRRFLSTARVLRAMYSPRCR